MLRPIRDLKALIKRQMDMVFFDLCPFSLHLVMGHTTPFGRIKKFLTTNHRFIYFNVKIRIPLHLILKNGTILRLLSYTNFEACYRGE
jgi:hypothetical protein